MPKPKGGRGVTAPYEKSIMVRCPLPLKPQVEQLKQRYQDYLDQGGDPFAPPPLLDASTEKKPVDKFGGIEQVPVWRVGDKCGCIQPSGVVIPEVRISYIDPKHGSCKVVEDYTKSHWLADLKELVPLAIISKLQASKKAENELVRKLDQELHELHAENGDLHFQIVQLRTELEQARSNSTAKPVNELSPQPHKPEYEFAANPVCDFEPLSQRALAWRLGVSHVTVGKHQKRATFPDWSKERDPQGIAWAYNPHLKKFQSLVDSDQAI